MGRTAGILWICATAAVLACATSPAPNDSATYGDDEAGSLQELTKVDVQRVDEETVITLVGLQDPAYSAYRVEEENLLVVELPGVGQTSSSLFGAIAGANGQLAVYDGLVEQVSTSTYDGDSEPVTRVEVAFAAPADYEVSQSSEGLEIRLRPAALAGAESDQTVASELADEANGTGDPWAAADPIEEDGDVSASEPIAVQESASLADASEAVALAPVQSGPASAVKSVGVTQTQAGVLLHLQADGMIISAESFTLADPDRLVVDLPGIKNDIAKDKVELDSEFVQRVRIGSHPDKLRIVLDGGPSADGFQGRRVIPAADGLYLTIGSGVDLDEALAVNLELSNGVASAAAAAAEGERLAAQASPVAEIDEVGVATDGQPDRIAGLAIEPKPVRSADEAEIYGLQYDRTSERDRIAVLSDRAVEFKVLTPDPETVVISIEHAVLAEGAGDRITPQAGGPVSLVSSFQQPDVAVNEVRVVMRRAPGLQPQVMRRGSLLFVDFENTGVAAAPPPAFIPGEPSGRSAPQLAVTESVSPDGVAAITLQPDDGAASAAAGAGAGLPDAYTALPEFDEPAMMQPVSDYDGGGLAAAARLASTSAPASLEPPAAVEMLEEGGLIDGKEYVGRRISLDFKNVEVSDVLRLIAEVSDLNIIAGDEVAGTITIRLVDVPWDQTLDVILLTKGLGFVRVGNVLRIAPSEILKVEEEVRLQERRNKEKLEDLEVKLQPVNYANVKDVSELIRRLLSPRGTVNVDQRTNTLIIKDISSVIDEATAMIRAIDTQTPQVMIEAKIVEANLEFARELGSTWGLSTQPWVNGFAPGTNPRTDLGNENFRFAGDNSVIFGNPITSVATGAFNFGGFLLDDKMAVEVHIEAMEATGDGKVISSPRIVTLDNREALIEQGVSIPFQTFEGGDAKLEFIDAVLSLRVTPHITTDKSIIMSLEVTRNAPDASVSTPTGSPAIAKNQAKTETLVKDGQTLVIGGIYTIDKTERSSRVPYLHRIPVLGAAFRSKEISDLRKELLIFVTPRVVVNPALAAS